MSDEALDFASAAVWAGSVVGRGGGRGGGEAPCVAVGAAASAGGAVASGSDGWELRREGEREEGREGRLDDFAGSARRRGWEGGKEGREEGRMLIK